MGSVSLPYWADAGPVRIKVSLCCLVAHDAQRGEIVSTLTAAFCHLAINSEFLEHG